MKNLSIKTKLILIFIFLKIIPLLIIAYIAYEGVIKLNSYLNKNTTVLFEESKKIITNTADKSIEDSIKHLDKKSQESLEKNSLQIAHNVASFLYERDNDLLFLSKIELNDEILKNFLDSKKSKVIEEPIYEYDNNNSRWIIKGEADEKSHNTVINSSLEENSKEFHYHNPENINYLDLNIYKEINYFDLKGNEIYKASMLSKQKTNVFNRFNTYLNAEDFKDDIDKLKKGEIYVSDVIGEYIPSKIIGTFTKEKTKKSGVEFSPEKHGYAGKENPLGKKFEGIIRFITPVYKNNLKLGYISLALNHKHIMEFTDNINPTAENMIQNIADASSGNYSFMWDYLGRNISHPRDYFIVGFDKKTGKRVIPWLSKDIADQYYKSNLEINSFLEQYPKFESQTSNKKPNSKQFIEDGNIALDCRYLNFAPQCTGWMEVTQNGGYGSFIIKWSGVWKLTTAASIPYYTGQYGTTKRGFGFVTVGANVDEFHAAANETKKDVEKILVQQTENMETIVQVNSDNISLFINKLLNELTFSTIFLIILMIFIALMLSRYISSKLEKLLIGTTKYSNNELDYRIEVTSNDEIGKLERSFNDMAFKLEQSINYEKDLNKNLEKQVEEEILKRRENEQQMIHQARLASMGEMIANIAHQWRQPLNALAMTVQKIKIDYKMEKLSGENLEQYVDRARNYIKNMSTTIDDFRDFFKPNKDKELFEINDCIKNSISIVEESLKIESISISFEKEDDIQFEGYKNELSHVILNILNNSKDAYKNVVCEYDFEIKIKTLVVENKINIIIQDNATGIPEDVINKVFDPYFTTKHQSQGTGIGLYMSKMIIERNMNGSISVENINGGARFTIVL